MSSSAAQVYAGVYMDLETHLRRRRNIRSIGFDDAHYADKSHGAPVKVAGVVCAGTRFEGMLWGELTKDGLDATQVLCTLLSSSKFAEQVHVVLTDGITFGGCNVVDLEQLHQSAGVPVIAVMRKPPHLENFQYVVDRLPDAEQRRDAVRAAGPICEEEGWVFQCLGLTPPVAAAVLTRITDQGKVPESLRLAHLIGAAVMLGESGKRA